MGGHGLLPGVGPAPAVISASRRTDLPAFHTPWLLQRLRDGRCEVRNPFNGTVRAVDLRPEAVLALVLWTRDPRPLLPHLDELAERGHPLLFLVTLNDYPAHLEPRLAPVDDVVGALHELRERLGPDAVVWRYDPVILADAMDPAWHLHHASGLAGRLAGATDQCIASWVDAYRKTERNLLPALDREGQALWPEDEERDRGLARDLCAALGAHGIGLTLCCEPALVQDAVPAASCVDPARLSRLAGREVRLPRRPTRPWCGCHASIDIGAYDTCPRGCVYCYANASPEAGRRGAARLARPGGD